jgi:hypothetical protein
LVRHQVLIGSGVVGVLVAAFALFWLLVPGRGGRPTAADLEAGPDEPTAEQAGPYGHAEAEPADILDARELLRTEALVHVGRGVQARPRDRDVDDRDGDDAA